MLEVNNLSAGYGKLQILWDISIKVEESEFVALLGPNGAGKSTFLHCLTGLLPPNQGYIQFKGKNINGMPIHEIAGLGISLVSEDGYLFNNMSVIDNLRMGAYTVKLKKVISENLDYVFGLFPRLKERSYQLAGTLSGGERKMVAIARGLMRKPKIILVDEPSCGLAPKLVATVFESLSILREQGITVLLVEQNTRQSLQIADRAYVLEEGKIMLEGTSCEIANNDYIKKAYLGAKVTGCK